MWCSGSPQVVVAVIGSGVEISHPAVGRATWNNVREVPGNGLDDDGNGKERCKEGTPKIKAANYAKRVMLASGAHGMNVRERRVVERPGLRAPLQDFGDWWVSAFCIAQSSMVAPFKIDLQACSYLSPTCGLPFLPTQLDPSSILSPVGD